MDSVSNRPLLLSPIPGGRRAPAWPQSLFASLIYALTALAGQRLALAYGAIPLMGSAAGIGVGLALAWGPQALGVVLVGGLLQALGQGLLASPMTPLACVVETLGALLQAGCGWGIWRYLSRDPSALPPTDGSGLGRLLVLLLLLCLIPPSLALLLDPDRAAARWPVGYSVHLLGLITLTPTTWWLARAGRSSTERRRAGSLALVSLTMAAMVGGLMHLAARLEAREQQARLFEQGLQLASSIEEGIQAQFNAVSALEAFLSAAPRPTAQAFARFSSRIRARNESIAVLEWVPRVPFGEREDFEAWAHNAVDPAFHIRENEQAATARALRHDHFPVVYADPLEGNRQAIGFDLGSNPARLKALKLAMASGQLAITERIKLVQDGKPAVLAAIPVYAAGQALGSEAARSQALESFALGVVRLSELVEGALQGQMNLDRLRLRLLDLTQPDKPVQLYPPENKDPQETQADDLADEGREHFDISVGGRRWSLVTEPATAALQAQGLGWNGWMMMLAALVLMTATVATTSMALGQEQTLRALVAQRTEALQTSESRLQLALHASRTGLWVWYPQSDGTLFSDTCFLLLGYEPDALPHQMQALYQLIHPDDLPGYQARLQEHLAGNSPDLDVEFRLRGQDASWRWLRSIGRVVERDGQGQARCLTGVLLDVSAAHQVQTDLAHARDLAVQANEVKSAFLAAISHELRTPLTGIQGFAELLEMRLGEERLKNLAATIRKGAEHLNQLLTEILDLAKVESGAMQLHYEEHALPSLIHFCAGLFEITAQAKQLEMRVELSAGLPQTLRCDAMRLKQVINNLLSNAIKFTASGQVTLRASTSGQRLLIEVIDTGPGIPLEAQELIFERFRQAHSRISYEHGGTGLGLALSRDLARLMGGTLTVRSEPGAGATFTLDLPLTPAPQA